MKLIDIVTSPWAIVPSKLTEIRDIYLTHLRGEKIDIKGIEARIGEPLQRKDQGYAVQSGVAIIPVDGVISKKMNLMTSISGGASTQLIERDIKNAINDPNVRSIILAVDSPGGSVDGTAELADVVKQASEIKPVVTWADGMIASAAYWIGSAADAIYISGSTATVGSIGVVATHVDVSQAEADQGVKTTEIYAGTYKRVASSYAPLSDAGRAYMQDQVDYLYSVFVDAVAVNRNVSTETVLKNMADGRLFIGQQAVDAGLVDGVSTLPDLIDRLAAGELPSKMIAYAGGSPAKTIMQFAAAEDAALSISNEAIEMMTKEQVVAAHPDIAEAFRAEGAKAERERIQSVEAQALPGHEALIATLKFDGKTSGPEAAVKILQAEKSVMGQRLASIEADAPKPVEATVIPMPKKSDNRDDMTVEDRCKLAWGETPAIRKEFVSLDSYIAYERALENGQVKFLKQNRGE